MTKFNLSEWALKNQSLLRYFIVLLALAGIWSYAGLGQSVRGCPLLQDLRYLSILHVPLHW